MKRLTFNRLDIPWLPLPSYIAHSGRWQFLIIVYKGAFTVSHRLRNPTQPVSASSTMQGPFTSLDDAIDAAETKLAELRRLS